MSAEEGACAAASTGVMSTTINQAMMIMTRPRFTVRWSIATWRNRSSSSAILPPGVRERYCPEGQYRAGAAT
jgi:hypothetical protein